MSEYELCGVRLKDVYRDAHGDLWEVIALCDQPQATFRRISNPLEHVEHVIGCRNMVEQFPHGPMREIELAPRVQSDLDKSEASGVGNGPGAGAIGCQSEYVAPGNGEGRAAPIGVRCRLGFHDYRYVGFRWVEKFPGCKTGWSHECSRCGKTIYWATGIVRDRAAA